MSIFQTVSLHLKYKRSKILYICIVSFTIYLILISTYNYEKQYVLRTMLLDMQKQKAMLRNSSMNSDNINVTCVIPKLPLFPPEITIYLQEKPLVNCNVSRYFEKDWVIVNASTCFITDEAKKKYGDIKCKFTDLIRINDNLVTYGNFTFSNSKYILKTSDAVEVSCVSAAHRQASWKLNLTGIRHDSNIMNRIGWSPKLPVDALKLNVLIFGFDSLSRNTFIRKLPESYKYITEVLEGHVLEGYNIVGDGTPASLVPILTGQSEFQLENSRKGVNGSLYVDEHPFIWNSFKDMGYVTGFFEDDSKINTFNYRFNGFKNVPTDHYMRPYYLATEMSYKNHPKLCYGSTPRHIIMFNHIKNFFQVYKNKPKFLFAFHNELSHNSFNYVGVADKDLVNLMTDLKEYGYLQNTLLIIMSDHGHRFVKMRNTLQGMQEERLPFFSFIFPEDFEINHTQAYQNFVNNKRKLTTPYDIYATLKSVLSLGHIGIADLNHRGLSLFSQIPEERNCHHAKINAYWCACLNWVEVPKNSSVVNDLTTTFLDTINAYTESKRRKCETFKLKEVLWVGQLSRNSQTKSNNILKEKNHLYIESVIYQIKVKLVPGNLLFEASIVQYFKIDRFEMDMKDVSRINTYKDHIWCLEENETEFLKYCYCKG